MVFSDKMMEHLNLIYRHERHNSYVYAKISNYLNVQGYLNLSKYYLDWSNHEMEHSRIVLKFYNDNNLNLDASISIDPLDIDLTKMDITHFVEITKEVENETTELYSQLLELSEEENNQFAKRLAHYFLTEQQEETDRANNIYDKITNIGNNRALLQIFDNGFGETIEDN